MGTCNEKQYQKKYTYQHYIYQISSSQALHTSQILYKQETSYMQWKINNA